MCDRFVGLRCRVGDLAIIVHDEPECHSNIGQIVEVLGKYKGFFDEPGFFWLIQPLGVQPSAVLICSNNSSKVKVVFDNRPRAHQDDWLRPLRTSENTNFDKVVSKEIGQKSNETIAYPIGGGS